MTAKTDAALDLLSRGSTRGRGYDGRVHAKDGSPRNLRAYCGVSVKSHLSGYVRVTCQRCISILADATA